MLDITKLILRQNLLKICDLILLTRKFILLKIHLNEKSLKITNLRSKNAAHRFEF